MYMQTVVVTGGDLPPFKKCTTLHIYIYVTESEFFLFFLFFPGNFTLCGGKKGFVPKLRTLR